MLKYINKESDQAVYNLQQSEGQNYNEVDQYLEGRYVGSIEAFMRILHEPIHSSQPPVKQLAVHLENGQRVYFNEETAQGVIDNPPDTTLTAFLKLCQDNEFARSLKYPEVPEYFTFSKKDKKWLPRKQGVQINDNIFKSNVISRIYNIHPRLGECYYLRLLLFEVIGPTSFLSFRTYNGVVHNTYRNACISRGLLAEDQHLRQVMQTAVEEYHSSHIRYLFCTILVFCEPSNPIDLWEEF